MGLIDFILVLIVIALVFFLISAIYDRKIIAKELEDSIFTNKTLTEKNEDLLKQIEAKDLQISKLKYDLHSEPRFTTSYKPLVTIAGCLDVPYKFFNEEQDSRDLLCLEYQYMRILHDVFDRHILPYIDFKFDNAYGYNRLIYEIPCVQGDTHIDPDAAYPITDIMFKLHEKEEKNGSVLGR